MRACVCVCGGDTPPAASCRAAEGTSDLFTARRGAHWRVYPAHTARGSPPPPAPSLFRAPGRGGMCERGLKRRLGEGGVRRQEMLIWSRVKKPPPTPVCKSDRCKRRQSLAVGRITSSPAPVMLPFVPLPCAQGNNRGRASRPPGRLGATLGAAGESWGAGRRAPASLTHTHTPARVFTALTQAYCDVAWVTARRANGGGARPRRRGRAGAPRPARPPRPAAPAPGAAARPLRARGWTHPKLNPTHTLQ